MFKRNKKASATKQSETPKKRFALRYVALAALVIALTGLAVRIPGWLAKLEAAQFTDLTVRGRLQQVDPEQVQALAAPYLQAGFMAVDMDALQQTIEALPWVARARVRREWPGKMIITVQEEVPAAIWNGEHLMNAYGEVFLRNSVAAEQTTLPHLFGPDGTQTILLAAFGEMQKLLRNRNANLEKVRLSDRRAWQLVISKSTPVAEAKAVTRAEARVEASADPTAKDRDKNAEEPRFTAHRIEVRLGSEKVEQRLARFVRAAWPVLQPKATQFEYVDMRYTNGFAVGSKVKTGV